MCSSSSRVSGAAHATCCGRMRAAVEKRVALVTGGARGIGRAIALALAADGRAVAVADVLSDGAEQTAAEIGGLGVSLDVTDSSSVAAAVDRIAGELGAVAVVVDCAGWDELRPFLDTDEEFWQRVIDINFTGMLRVTKAVLPGMVDAGWGRVVNIASDAGRVGSSLESVYSGAKGGVIAFTKTIAREVARSGVTANTVCPGPTRTAFLERIAGGDEGARVIDAMTRAVPMKRLGTPADIAAAVAFLASDEAGF